MPLLLWALLRSVASLLLLLPALLSLSCVCVCVCLLYDVVTLPTLWPLCGTVERTCYFARIVCVALLAL